MGRNEKKTEQAERYRTDYYGIRNKDGTNRMRKDGTGGTKRNRILWNTEHRQNIRIANYYGIRNKDGTNRMRPVLSVQAVYVTGVVLSV